MNRRVLSNKWCAVEAQNWWHDIVNNEQLGWSVDDYIAAIESCLERDVQRDLNKLDKHGTTALHEAVKLQNAAAKIAAIEALLRCGADINVVDSRKKTALAYLSRQLNEVCVIYFLVRINILAYLDLPICQQNRHWYRDWHSNIYGAWEYNCSVNRHISFDEIAKYALYSMVIENSAMEIRAIQETRVNDQMTLHETLTAAGDEGIVVCQLDDLQALVKSHDFDVKFVDFGGLVKQRYRKALFTRAVRCKQLKPLVVQALGSVLQLPDLCNELIVHYLSYNDLLSMLKALGYTSPY